jgi:Tol biopolymer transport system component
LFAAGPSQQGGKTLVRSISVLTGAVESVADQGVGAEASPDGKQILIVDDDGRQIRLAGIRGESPRVLCRALDGEVFSSAHWLPDGRRIGYLRGPNLAPDAWIETRDVGGADARPVVEANIWSVAFAPDGNVFYTTRDGEPQQSVSLWTVLIDPRRGVRAGEPALLARWPGAVAAEPLTISADGRRLGQTKQYGQSDVYALTLDAAGQAVTATRQLTTDTQVDWPAQWAPDGSSFLYVSNRTGSLHAFRQPIASETAEAIGTGGAAVRSPQITADGRWIVYVEMTYQPASARVMRVPIAGGPAQQVMTLSSTVATADLQFWAMQPGAGGTGARSFPDVRCPAAFDHSCVIAEARGSGNDPFSQILVSAFDPLVGHTRRLASVTPGNGAGLTAWDVSPDGRTIAFCEFAWDGGNRITLVAASTGDTRAIDITDFKNIVDIAWAPDGRSLFATTATIHGGELIRVMLDGSAVLLRRLQSQTLFAPRPSPDGRSLLVGVQQTNSNAWVLER